MPAQHVNLLSGAAGAVALLLSSGCATEPLTSQQVLASSADTDWRALDIDELLVMSLPQGDVVIELAPLFAPRHVDNIKRLVSQRYFDDARVVRVQDNYVVQWGDPDADNDRARSLGAAAERLAGEYFRELSGLTFSQLAARDAYAERVGFVSGFPVGTDGKRAWLTHCYAMVGVGRDNAADSGNGSSLYVVSGHAPRHLDRNVTLVGRIVVGMEHVSALPRGSGPLGFYQNDEKRPPILRVRHARELPVGQQPSLEKLRTDSAAFRNWIDARRSRTEDWFIDPANAIGLCNVPLPVRPIN